LFFDMPYVLNASTATQEGMLWEHKGQCLYRRFSVFSELTENVRQQHDPTFLQHLRALRTGEATPALLDWLSSTITRVDAIPHEARVRAKWFATLNDVVDATNVEQQALRGTTCIRMWAQHVQAHGPGRPHKHAVGTLLDVDAEEEPNLGPEGEALATEVHSIPQTVRAALLQATEPHGAGHEHLPLMLDLAVGTPVRITRNLGTLAGIVNGSTGRVFGFLYQNTPAAGHIVLRPSAADAAHDCPPLPIVLVKMDRSCTWVRRSCPGNPTLCRSRL
jgi:hypothetical protein